MGIVDRAIGIDDPIAYDERAYDAEVWFGERYPGLTSYADHPVPTTCDFAGGGLCLDVKWTKRQDGGLIVTTYPDRPRVHYCDYYVLVIGWPDYKPFRIAGYASADEVRASWSDGKADLLVAAHYLRQDELHTDIDALMREMGEDR
jgi:hypothetical protein